MNKIISLLSVILSFQVMAQTFKLTDDSRANLNVCQYNHNVILDKFINQMNSQGSRLIQGISVEKRAGTSNYKLKLYRSVLTEIVLKRIIYSKIKNQLNRQTLKSFYGLDSNYHKDYLNVDAIQVDLGAELYASLIEIKDIGKINIAINLIQDQYSNILNDASNILFSKRYQKVGAGLYSRIAGKSVGQIATKQILQKATLSLGSKLFISASRGMMIDLLTIPLKGSRLPPETLWTDLLEVNPELIIVPEWMRRGGIGDHPWYAHCNAIQTRTEHVEISLQKILKLEETSFMKRVTNIHNMDNEIPNFEEESQEDLRSNYRPIAIDNTYVHRPVGQGPLTSPVWARLSSKKK